MKSYFLIIYILLSSFIYAQLETAHWFFGNHAGLDFTSGSPVADTNGALDTWEGCSSISDKNGNLLFYTDGSTVYNKNHSIMSNGTGLLGNSSSTQSGIIIPDPYTPTLYYIFSVHTNDISPTNSQGIHYSLVDMSLDYGNGAVISGKKNIPLPLNGVQKSFENITAVKHANGKDIWIITQFIDKFYAFKIDNSGLNTIPVISKVGISVPLDHDCRLGYIKISPDSKKLAIAHYSKALAIYDFNSFTGEVSNEVILDTNKHFYGIEFSPNSKILYSSEADETTIHQYDLTAISIPNSKFLLYKGNNQSYFGALQLGLDKKIYHTAINDKALSVIENPDIYKSGANFKPLTINLGGKISTYGLPSIMVSFFNGTILINGDLNLSEFCLNEPLTFSLNTNLSTYTANWDFGDGNTVINNNTPIHTYTTFGTYLVKVILKYKDLNENEQNITFDKTITIHPKPSVNLGPDKILCEGTSVTLDAGNPGASYLWSTGETTQTINVIKSGSYSVTVTDKNGCSNSDEVMVTVNPKPSVNLGPDKILCEGTSVTLDAGNPGASYLWSTGETTQTINVIKSGSYSVTVTDKNGCSNSDEVMVTVNPNPSVYLGLDQILCEGTSVTLDAGNPGASYLWSTGETTQTINVIKSGSYSVTVTDYNNCSVSSSVIINFLNPFIKEVKVNKNTAEIVAIENSLLQYSLDMIHWQYSPVFYNLEFKIYNAYVKNASGCISAPLPFGLLNVPNIITPNKDGINDVWNLKGLELYPGSSVKIFDRYGKLLVNTKIDKGFVWDGKYLGKNVATASYWYIIELTDGRKLTGWIMVRNYNEKDQ